MIRKRWTHVSILIGLLGFFIGCQDRALHSLENEKSPENRIQAVMKLAEKKSRRAVKPLMAILESGDDEPDLKAAAAYALGEIGDSVAVDALINTLRTERNSKIGVEAAKALGYIGDKRAIEPLFDAQAGYPFAGQEVIEDDVFVRSAFSSLIESEFKIRDEQAWASFRPQQPQVFFFYCPLRPVGSRSFPGTPCGNEY